VCEFGIRSGVPRFDDPRPCSRGVCAMLASHAARTRRTVYGVAVTPCPRENPFESDLQGQAAPGVLRVLTGQTGLSSGWVTCRCRPGSSGAMDLPSFAAYPALVKYRCAGFATMWPSWWRNTASSTRCLGTHRGRYQELPPVVATAGTL